jgi:hypothetical protein
LLQDRKEHARGLDRAEEIGLHDRSEHVRRRIGEVSGRPNARIVHEHVKAAEFVLRGSDHGVAALGGCHVGLNDRQRRPALGGFVGELVEQFLVAGRGQHFHSALGRKKGERPTDPLRRPGDQHAQSGEFAAAAHGKSPGASQKSSGRRSGGMNSARASTDQSRSRE